MWAREQEAWQAVISCWVEPAALGFVAAMAAAPTWALPIYYERLLDAIAACEIDVRPGRREPRALTREWKHYPHLRMTRSAWRNQRLRRTG